MAEREKSVYHLQIVDAVMHGRPNKPPNPYIRVEVDAFTTRTKSVKRTSSPLWNEEFTFAAPSSSTIRIRAKHDTAFFKSRLLGEVAVAIEALSDMGKDKQDILLKLEAAGAKGDAQERGEITIRFWTEETIRASAAAVSNARQAVEDRWGDGNTASKSLEAVVSKLKIFAEIGNEAAKIHPYVNLVWQTTSSVYKIVRNQLDRDEKVIDLLASMENVYSFVDEIQSLRDKNPTLDNVIKLILQQTFECAIFIQEYVGSGFAKTALKEAFSDRAAEQIEMFTTEFRQLKSTLDTGIGVQNIFISSRVLEKVDVIARNQNLSALQPAAMDQYGRPECLPGTRVDVLNFITTWATNSGSEHNALWLHGVAGSGKSTLSTTVANLFDDTNRLGAFIFFNRNVDERSNPAIVIRTLAHKLGCFDGRIGDALASVIEHNSAIVEGPLNVQFKKLLLEPLRKLENLHFEGPIVVVFDAFDECGGIKERKLLLKVLAEESAKLPRFLRIIITSRSEHDIRHFFESRGHILSYRLNINSELVRKDIESFLRHRMAEIRSENSTLLSVDWPGESRLCTLAERASGLFVWASTACNFIDAYDPEQRLSIVLQADIGSDAESALDSLYVTALRSAGHWEDPGFGADFRAIVGTLLVVRNPLSLAALNKLLSIGGQRPPSHAISRLGCVLYSNAIIRILHPSFADFLSNQIRCQCDTWFIDMTSHNLRVARFCLDRMDSYLRYNVCNLELSTTADTTLPEDVAYVCDFWVEHICIIEDAASIADRLETFLFKHLMHWFEAMSILKRSRKTIDLMRRLRGWHAIALPDKTRSHELVNDACRFAQVFGDTIEHHPLQVYAGALAFTPTSTMLYRTFHDISRDPWLTMGAHNSWSPLLLALPDLVHCQFLQFSPDSTRVLSATVEWMRAIHVHDTTTGTVILGPISGGPCCFSSDGLWVISMGAESLEVWDSMSGAQVLEPLRLTPDMIGGPAGDMAVSSDGNLVACAFGPTTQVWNLKSGSHNFTAERPRSPESIWPAAVTCLAFSPNSTRIVAGFHDGGICSWECNSGAETYEPLHGHAGPVLALYMTSDGTQILSVGSDSFIQFWDVVTGTSCRTTSLQGLNDAPTRAIFSADGQQVLIRIAGGSLGLWDTLSGVQIRVIANDSGNYALAMSPNKIYVASAGAHSVGLYDANVDGAVELSHQMWNTTSLGLSYSPDGTRIAVAANENSVVLEPSIFILDGITGMQIDAPLRGHKGETPCVAFSWDGLQMVSGAADGIRVWDVLSGTQISAITTLPVTSVAFSPDGRHIVSGYKNGIIRTWDASSRVPLLSPFGASILETRRFPKVSIQSVAYSPDGTQIRSCSFLSRSRLWDATSGVHIVDQMESSELQLGVAQPEVAVSGGMSSQRLGSFTGTVPEGMLSRTSQQAARNPYDRFVVTSDKWIKDTTTGLALCYPPIAIFESTRVWTASSQTSIAFATQTDIYVMHFPPWMLSAASDIDIA